MTNTATATRTLRVGDRVRFQHPTSNGGMVTFTAIVRKLDGDRAWVEMPARVRAMPFAPLDGKRYGLYDIAKLVTA